MDFQFSNSPPLDRGRARETSVDARCLINLIRLTPLTPLSPFSPTRHGPNWIHGNSLSSSPPAFDSPPKACFAFYLFWRFSRRQQKFDLGHERKSLIRSRCQWVWPCHTAQIRLRWKQSLDELIETSDEEDFFSNVVDRLTLLGHSEARIHGVRWSLHRFTDWNIRKCFPWELGNENINMGWGEISRICGRPYYNILTGQVKSISNLMMLYLLARPDVASV